MKKEHNDLYKLIISLYIDNPVCRTSDYTIMLINEKLMARITYSFSPNIKINLSTIIGRIP